MKKRQDGRYCLQETLTINGVKKKYCFYGQTEKECKAKRDELIRSNNPEKMTLEDVYNKYKEIEERRIKYSEFNQKCKRIEFFESLFPVRLNDVTPAMIAIELNKIAVDNPKTGKPTAKRTLTRYVQALSNVYEYAEANRWTTYNPCKYVNIPTNAPQEQREALSPAEYNFILNSTDERFLAAKILILSGLRRGELAALTWQDVDFENNVLHITKSYDYHNEQLKLPKSKSGIRDVPMPLKLKNLLEPISRPSGYVINDNGKMLTGGQWSFLNKYLRKQCGFNFSWHILRHTYATILYDSDVPILSAQKFLGHSSPRITMEIYTHLSERKKQASISALDNFLD